MFHYRLNIEEGLPENTSNILLFLFSYIRRRRRRITTFTSHGSLCWVLFLILWYCEQAVLQDLWFVNAKNCLWTTTQLSKTEKAGLLGVITGTGDRYKRRSGYCLLCNSGCYLSDMNHQQNEPSTCYVIPVRQYFDRNLWDLLLETNDGLRGLQSIMTRFM